MNDSLMTTAIIIPFYNLKLIFQQKKKLLI